MTDQIEQTAPLTEAVQKLEAAIEEVDWARNSSGGTVALSVIDALADAANALLRQLHMASTDTPPVTVTEPEPEPEPAASLRLADPINPLPGDIWHDALPSFTGGSVWHARADANGDVELYQPNYPTALIPAHAVKSMRGGMTLIGGAEPACPTCKSGHPGKLLMTGCGFRCDDPRGWHANGGVARHV